MNTQPIHRIHMRDVSTQTIAERHHAAQKRGEWLANGFACLILAIALAWLVVRLW